MELIEGKNLFDMFECLKFITSQGLCNRKFHFYPPLTYTHIKHNWPFYSWKLWDPHYWELWHSLLCWVFPGNHMQTYWRIESQSGLEHWNSPSMSHWHSKGFPNNEWKRSNVTKAFWDKQDRLQCANWTFVVFDVHIIIWDFVFIS